MPTFVLDAGALIAVDRGDRDVLAMLHSAFDNGYSVLAPAGVIGQVWRDSNRQVVLARTLKRCDEVPLDGSMARVAGQLCSRAGTSDVIDASVAVVASSGASPANEIVVLTSDTGDMRALLSEVRTGARIIGV